MTTEDLEIKITLDDPGVLDRLDRIEGKVEDVGAATERASERGFSKLGASLVAIESGISLASRAFSGLSTALGSISGALSEAARVEGLVASFENLQASADAVASETLPNLREATLGLVSDLDLIQQSNQAVLLGLPVEGFDELAGAAVKLGAATNRTANEALSDLVTGLGRSSALILDNLGITVKATEAQEARAASLGKTVQQLTEVEKAEAFRALAIEKIRQKSAELADITETAATANTRLAATIQNSRNEFLLALSGSESLGDSLNDLSKALDDIDWEAAGDLAAEFADQVVKVGAVVAKAFRGIIEQNDKLTAGFVSIRAAGALKFFQELEEETTKTREGYRKLSRALAIYGDELRQSNNPSSAAANLYERLVRRQEEYAEALFGSAVANGIVLNSLKGPSGSNNALEEQDEKLKGLTDSWQDYNEILQSIVSGGDTPLARLQDQLISIFEDRELYSDSELTQAIGALREGFTEAGVSAEDFNEVLSKVGGTAIREIEEIESRGGFLGALFGGDVGEGFGQELGASLRNAFSNLATALRSGDSDALKEVGVELGGDLGAAIGKDLTGGSELGSFIGEFLGETIVDGLISTFSKSDPQNDARKAADRFFAEVLEGANFKAIIDGELQDLFDFEFGTDGNQFENPDWPAYFQGLPVAAQEAFSGVALGFTGLLDDGELVAGQLATIFAQNLGGDLLNLRAFVLATGASFEELEAQIVQAAVAGEVSFLEATSALQGLGQLSLDQIAQTTDLQGAFDQLFAAGSKGGRLTTDALKLVGLELEELGADTIPEAEDALRQLGFGEEFIAALTKAFGEAGIAVGDLADATENQLVVALGSLEASGFLEDTQKTISDIVDEIDRIPENIETRITVKVRTEAEDRGAEQVIASQALGEGLGRRA